MRQKLDELLGHEEDSTANEEINNSDHSNPGKNDNRGESYVEGVSVQKKGGYLDLSFQMPMWYWISASSLRRKLLLQAHEDTVDNWHRNMSTSNSSFLLREESGIQCHMDIRAIQSSHLKLILANFLNQSVSPDSVLILLVCLCWFK